MVSLLIVSHSAQLADVRLGIMIETPAAAMTADLPARCAKSRWNRHGKWLRNR